MLKTCSNIFFPLITFPYISRILLPDNVGKVNFGSSFVSYFSMIASLGISTYAIRECASVREDKSKLSNVASQIVSINIYTSLFSYLLLAISLIFFRKLDNYRVIIIIQSLAIILTTLGADWLNTAMEDFRYITIRTIFVQIISLVAMFLFVKVPEDYINYAIISVVSSSSANILNIWYRRRYCIVKFSNKIDWKKHMPPILFLFVMTLSQLIFNNVDITMLGIIHGDYEVGLYSTTVKITNLVSQVVSSVLWVVMPRLSFYFAVEDYAKINALLRKILGSFIMLGLPCVTGVFILAKEIILIIAGSEYIEAVSSLRILMISFLFSLFGGSFLGNIILLPSRQEKKFMNICCIAAIVNVIANYIFIPSYGVNAAAVSTAFSSLLILILLLSTVQKEIKIENMVKLFTAPVIGCMAILLFSLLILNYITVLWFRTAVCIIVSVFIYVIILFVLKNEAACELIESAMKKLKIRGK